VGRSGKVIATGTLEGAVEIDGIRWRASWAGSPDLAEGTPITVTANRGMLLEVVPVD